MPTIPTYEQRTSASGAGLGPGPVDSGVGLRALGSGISDVSAALAQAQRQDAEREAAAWATTALSTFQAEQTQSIEDQKTNAPAGAPAFTPSALSAFDKRAEEILGDAPTPNAKQFMRERLATFRASVQNEALNFEATSRIANNTDIGKASIDAARNELQVKPEKFAERLAERRALFDAMAMPPKQKADLDEYALRTMAHDSVAGLIEQNPYKALKAINTEPGKSGFASVDALNADDRLVLRNAAQAEIHRREEQARVRESKVEAIGLRAMNEMDRQIASGVPATADMWSHWAEAVKPSSYAPEFAERVKGEQEVQAVLRRPIDEQLKYVQDLQSKLDTEGGTLAEATNVARLRQAVGNNVKTLTTDPLIFNANRTGEAPAPLDLTKLGAQGDLSVAATLSDRVSTIEGMRKQYGETVPMKPLLPQETAQLAGILDRATANQSTELFSTLRSAAGNDQTFVAMMQQIAPDSPVKALAGMLAAKQRSQTLERHWFTSDSVAQSQNVAATIMLGQDILRPTKSDKGSDGAPRLGLYLPPEAVSRLQSDFQSQVGQVFADRPGAADIAFQAVKSYYVGRAAQTGRIANAPTDVESGLVKEAIGATLGEVVDYNGNGEVLAPWGMDASIFEDRVRQAFVVEAKKRGLQENAAQQLPALGLRNAGDGTYYVVQGKNFIYDRQGNPLIIDVNDPASTPPSPVPGSTGHIR